MTTANDTPETSTDAKPVPYVRKLLLPALIGAVTGFLGVQGYFHFLDGSEISQC